MHSKVISWLLLEQNRARLFRWSSIFGGFAVVQLLVQALNAVSGFLLVRSMEKPDYAWFTIASGMSSALAILSDSGVGIAATSIGGTIWQDKASMKGLVQAALRLRLKLAAIASVAVSGISLWMLLRNGAGLASALGLTALVLAPIWQVSATAVLNVVNRLHSRTRQLQVADLVPAVVRAVLTAALALLGGLSPFSALGAVVIAQFIQYGIVHSQVRPLLNEEPRKMEESAVLVWKTVRQHLPNTIFWCFQGQLTTWLISMVASVQQVADFGALNRLGIIYVVIGGPLGHFVLPAIARVTEKRRLCFLIISVILGVLSFNILIVLCAQIKGDLFLMLLGFKYAHLQQELVLVLAGMAISNVTGVITALNHVQGWIKCAWLFVPITLTAQTIGFCLIKVDTIKGLAWFIICTSTIQCCHAIVNCLIGFRYPVKIKVK